MTKGEAETREGVCVYCGKRKPVTTEHVVARAFFPKPKPSNLITVDACYDCNNTKSKQDLYVRDILLLDMSSSQNVKATSLRDGEFIRSVESNRSEMARVVMSDARPQPLLTPLGDYLGHVFAVPIERERWDRYFGLMVRGLWYHLRKELIPDDCKFDVYAMDRFYVQPAWEEMAALGAELCVITPEVFASLYLIDPDYPFLSRWLLLFYGTTIVEVYTIPNGLNFTPRQSHRGIGVGDIVAFTDAALKDFGDFAESLAKARGLVSKLLQINDIIIAQIKWDRPDIPASVNAVELRRVDGTPNLQS